MASDVTSCRHFALPLPVPAMTCLLRIISLSLLLLFTAVFAAEESTLPASWDTDIIESSSTSAVAGTTGTSASAFDTNETAPQFLFIFVETSSTESVINETTPSIDVKVEDGNDHPTPTRVPTVIDEDDFPTPSSSPMFNAPYVGAYENPSSAPAASIRDNSQGEVNLQPSSTSILVTAAGVVHPMKAAGFFSSWFHLRAILQQYLPDDFLHWRLRVHHDFSMFLSDGQQQNVVNSLRSNPLGRFILQLFAKLGLVAQYQVDDMLLQLDLQRNDDYEQARPMGRSYIQQREYDVRTNFVTPEWRMNMLELKPLHPIHEEMLAARVATNLADDILAVGAVAALAEASSQDQADKLSLLLPTNVPLNSVTEVVVAFEAALDQPMCLNVNDDTLVCDIVRGEKCINCLDTVLFSLRDQKLL